MDGLIELVDELKEKAETERSVDDSEAVLDEGSFEAKVANKYRRISSSHNYEEILQKRFVKYFKSIASKDSARFVRGKTVAGRFRMEILCR